MKQITAPAPIKINESLTLTFQQFIGDNILMDLQFGKNLNALMSAHNIQISLSQSPILIDDDDWDLLINVLEFPTNGYQPKLALQLIPFIQAVLDACEVS